MPNILLTNYCNRACNYCFAREKVSKQRGANKHKNLNISLENIEYLIKFFKKSKHNTFSILGGEPTLHPQFEQILDQVLENDFTVRIFTNGLMNRAKQKVIFRNNVDIILNINEPCETSAAHLKILESVYGNLGPNIHPGFNIYKENFDFSFIFDLIERYYMPKEIRLGISQPIVDHENQFVPVKQYRKIGKKLVLLAEEAHKRDIKLNFDCGFVLCMFTKTDVGKMIYSNAHLQFACGPTIDIDPELNMWHCFPLSTIKNRNLKDFEDLESLINYFGQIKKKFLHVGMFARCKSCVFLKRQQCSGGCISHKIKNNPHTTQSAFL